MDYSKFSYYWNTWRYSTSENDPIAQLPLFQLVYKGFGIITHDRNEPSSVLYNQLRRWCEIDANKEANIQDHRGYLLSINNTGLTFDDILQKQTDGTYNPTIDVHTTMRAMVTDSLYALDLNGTDEEKKALILQNLPNHELTSLAASYKELLPILSYIWSGDPINPILGILAEVDSKLWTDISPKLFSECLYLYDSSIIAHFLNMTYLIIMWYGLQEMKGLDTEAYRQNEVNTTYNMWTSLKGLFSEFGIYASTDWETVINTHKTVCNTLISLAQAAEDPSLTPEQTIEAMRNFWDFKVDTSSIFLPKLNSTEVARGYVYESSDTDTLNITPIADRPGYYNATCSTTEEGDTYHNLYSTFTIRDGNSGLTTDLVSTNGANITGIIGPYTSPQFSFTVDHRWEPIGSGEPPTCLTSDTLITLFNGTTKRADEIQVGDELLCFDRKGRKHKDVVIFTDNYMKSMTNHGYYEIDFEGHKVNIVHNHRFWNAAKNRMMHIFDWEIGKDYGLLEDGTKVTLTGITFHPCTCQHHSIITRKYRNYLANGVQSGFRWLSQIRAKLFIKLKIWKGGK